jgi:chemotaxis protein MotB
MAKRKKEAAPEGAPLWMTTYGDMVTLLLVFFVMLLAMSEVKDKERFVQFMEAIKDAFGYVGGVREVPTDDMERPKNDILDDITVIPVNPEDMSKAPDPGIRGDYHDVTNIRRGKVFAVGGKLEFEPLSASPTDEHKKLIAEFADKLRGYSTMVEVRGHCSKVPVDGSGFGSHVELAFARAKAVADELVQNGIERRRLEIVAAGTNQPVSERAYSSDEHRRNDVVELLQIDRAPDE